MQFYFQINDAHLRFITDIGYNPFKHEIVTGAEDGLVKFWELETGKFISSYQAHQGWVTSFLFWKTAKLMLSSSHDCTIALWQGNSVLQIINFEEPIFKLCLDSSENFLMCGTSEGLHVYVMDKNKNCGSYIDVNNRKEMKENSGIVRCIVACEGRIFCAGFDKKLVMYDCLYYGSDFLKIITIIEAHEAAITCLCVNKDCDNNIWIITGAFDKVVKIWNSAGKLVHRIDGFSTSIIGICSVDRTKQIWVSTGGPCPMVFDIRSGEDVSQFSNNFQKIEGERFRFQLIKYFPEVGMVIATTTRRHVLAWRSQTASAVTRLICGVPIDSICLSVKPPILILCAVKNGQLIQWEKRESNEASFHLDVTKLSRSMKNIVDQKLKSSQLRVESSYSKIGLQQSISSTKNKTGKRFLQMMYNEPKDLLFAAAEDGIIYMFSYDDELNELMKQPYANKSNKLNVKDGPRHQSKISEESLQWSVDDNDATIMRITGLTCQKVFLDHKNVVSGIDIVPPGFGRKSYFLLSCSWDQRICVWNLETFNLETRYQNIYSNDRDGRELAADDVITSIAYSSSRDQFAYSSADYLVYIRKFSTNGTQMNLITTINFNESEITVLCWISHIDSWVTASDDYLIKIWSSTGNFNCTQTINTGGPVASICYDDVSQILVAAIGHEIKLFDIIEERMVQVNCGHSDDVRSVVILPGKHQFASAGEDGQLLIWNSWMRPKKYIGTKYNEN